MVSKRRFALIGGDNRIVALANALFDEGNQVLVYGIAENTLYPETISFDLERTIEASDIIVLPLPALNNSGNINAPYTTETIEPVKIFKAISERKILLGGKLHNSIHQLAKLHGVTSIDYFTNEALTVTNASITAEGAIKTLQSVYDRTICNSKVLVLGFGRIGKLLSKILRGFGASVSIFGRRSETKAWASAYGNEYIDSLKECTSLSQYDVIFNTVPELILDAQVLNTINKNAIIIDLASGKGGTDFKYASDCGIHAVHALSLPGLTAPRTAGDAIKTAITQICNELEV